LEKKRENQNMDKNPQVVYQWRAPLRPYKRRSALILRFYLAVAFLLSAILMAWTGKLMHSSHAPNTYGEDIQH